MSRAGQFRHRVAIQSPTDTVDASGGPIVSFSTAATRWAKVVPLRGDEGHRGDATEAHATHEVTFRHGYALTPQMRLVWVEYLEGSTVRTHYLNIVEIRDVMGRDRETVVTCSERFEDSSDA